MDYTVIDFETTGLNHLSDQIIEIGAIKVNEQFEEIGRLHTMVKLVEGRVLTEFISDLTGITLQDTLHGVSLSDGLSMLKAFIGNSTVIAQHAPFDLSFLAAAFEPELFADTRSMAKLLYPKENASLSHLVNRYGITLENHHRSIADCEATLKVFQAMQKELNEKGMPYMCLVFSTKERPLTFVPESAIVVDLDGYIETMDKLQKEKEAEESENVIEFPLD